MNFVGMPETFSDQFFTVLVIVATVLFLRSKNQDELDKKTNNHLPLPMDYASNEGTLSVLSFFFLNFIFLEFHFVARSFLFLFCHYVYCFFLYSEDLNSYVFLKRKHLTHLFLPSIHNYQYIFIDNLVGTFDFATLK